MEIVGYLVGIVFFIILEGFFAGSEIALVSTDRNKILSYYKRFNYKFLKDFYDNPEDYITLTMLGYTVSIVFTSTFYTLTIMSLVPYVRFLSGLEVLFSTTIVLFTLVLGEIIPKSLFQKHAEKLIIPSLWLLEKLKTITAPILKLSRLVSRTITDKLKDRFVEKLNRKDLLQLISYVGNSEFDIVYNTLSLKDKRLSEVFKPLYQVVMVSEDTVVYNVLKWMKESKYTKLPVYRSRVDNIVGYVELFDLIDKPDLDKVKNYVKPVIVLPEFATLYTALKSFSTSYEKMGIVVDEKGIVLGIFTIDDIFKEVIGYIGDEQTKEPEEIKEVEKDKWVISAEVTKDELENYLKIKLPDGPYNTIGGLLLHISEKIPTKGEVFEYGDLRFKILQSDSKKIIKVMLERVQGENH